VKVKVGLPMPQQAQPSVIPPPPAQSAPAFCVFNLKLKKSSAVLVIQ